MRTNGDIRYRSFQVLREHPERFVAEAEDALTSLPVILKLGGKPVIDEFLAMLAIPAGVGAAALDAAWLPDGRFMMVQEKMAGRIFLDAVAELDRASLPELLRSICQVLTKLHRAGYVHGDIGPTNIICSANGSGIDARLLDFGCAAGGEAADRNESGGGIPGLLAPETWRGWVLDGRVDQYALGMTLAQTLPRLGADPIWKSLLDKMHADRPPDRFPDMVAVRQEVERLFDLPPKSGRLPDLGGCPLFGRDDVIDAIANKISTRPGSVLLIQARAGDGLSRALLESVAEIARRGGPPVRALDLGHLSGFDIPTLKSLIHDCPRSGHALICGIDDPSPGLRRLAGGPFEWLPATLRAEHAERMTLRALDKGAFAEIVAASLGTGGPASEELAHALHDRCDGNLTLAAEGFTEMIASCGVENGIGWRLDAKALESALSRWKPQPPGPSFSAVDSDLRTALQACARVGRSLQSGVARELIQRFAAVEHWPRLKSDGWLLRGEDDRVEFVSASLWSEAATLPFAASGEVDEWLNESFRPDPSRVGETIRACRRARRLGDLPKESAHLRAAIDRSHAERRWSDLLQLFPYPGEMPARWTTDWAITQAASLSAMLGGNPSPELLLYNVGLANLSRAPEIAAQLLERVAQGSDARIAADACGRLMERAVARSDEEAAGRHLAALEELGRGANSPIAGLVDFHRALRAKYHNDDARCVEFAQRAAERLRGSGTVHETLALQLLAVQTYDTEPLQAIMLMETALRGARDAEQEAQLRVNLAQMYDRLGDSIAAAACAEAGILRLGGKASVVRLAALRLHRAWAWAHQDRVEDAEGEVSALLALHAVRQVPALNIPVQILAGFCHLHRGSERAALSRMALAWQLSRAGSTRHLRASSLNWLIDALLDLQPWMLIARDGGELFSEELSDDAETRRAMARVRALREQAAGRPAEALAILAPYEDDVRRLHSPRLRARFSHHLGSIHLGLGAAGRAKSFEIARRRFDDAYSLFGSGRYTYWRARALQRRAAAEIGIGDGSAAIVTLDLAVDLARRCGCRTVLRQCLHARVDQDLARDGRTIGAGHERGTV